MSVYQRGKKKVYYMDFSYLGVRVHESTEKTDKTEAEFVEAKRKLKIKEEATLPPYQRTEQITLGQAVDRCYADRWAATRDAEQVYARAKAVAAGIGENVLLSRVDAAAISAFIGKLRAGGLKPATLNRYRATIKTLLNVAFKEWGAIPAIPYVKMDRERNGRIRILTAEEEAKLLSTLRSSKRLWAQDVADLVEVLLCTGMRLNEAVLLTAKDVDFGAKRISAWVNKGDKPRTVPMTAHVADILSNRPVRGDGRFFPMRDTQVERVWKWTRKLMGLQADEQFVPHALRHTCASRLVMAGVDLYTVKALLGHSTIKVTERYAHLAPSVMQKVEDALEAMAKGGPEDGALRSHRGADGRILDRPVVEGEVKDNSGVNLVDGVKPADSEVKSSSGVTAGRGHLRLVSG